MNPELPPDAKPGAESGTRRFALKVWTVLAVLVLAVCGVILIIGTNPDQEVAWLAPAELARATHPGPLTQMRYQIARALGPVWQFFRGRRTQINVTSKLITLPPKAPETVGLNAALATNSDGTRVWVLSAVETGPFKQRLSGVGGSLLSQSSVTTLDGRHTQVFSGGSPPSGTNAGVPTCSLDLTTRLLRDSFRLTLGVTATEFVPSASPPIYDLRTNIFAALRVLVHNSGGVLMISGTTNSEGLLYGIIISPVAIDPAGNPLKL